MAKSYFPTLANQEEIKNKINGLTSGMNNHDAAWTPGRAAKLDNIQTVLNTPDGNTLAAWISAIDTKALNAYNKAEAARVSADNAANQAYAATNLLNDWECTNGALARLKLITTNTYNATTANPTQFQNFRLTNTTWSYINGRGTVFLFTFNGIGSLSSNYKILVKINNGAEYSLDAAGGRAGVFLGSINFTGKIELKVNNVNLDNFVVVNYVGY